MTNEVHSTKLVGVFSPVGTDGMSGTHTLPWDGPRSERGEREGKREEEGGERREEIREGGERREERRRGGREKGREKKRGIGDTCTFDWQRTCQSD